VWLCANSDFKVIVARRDHALRLVKTDPLHRCALKIRYQRCSAFRTNDNRLACRSWRGQIGAPEGCATQICPCKDSAPQIRAVKVGR